MPWFPKNIVVVPVDYSEPSFAAIETAKEFVDDPARIHVIHVLFPMEATASELMWGLSDNESRIRAARNQIEQSFKERGIEGVTLVVKAGDPGLSIADYAKECRADLVVIPSHGYHGVKRLLLGSVTERVLRHASCPVLVLRRQDAD
jgi:nucleotide-binding universal stress UspA family protein